MGSMTEGSNLSRPMLASLVLTAAAIGICWADDFGGDAGSFNPAAVAFTMESSRIMAHTVAAASHSRPDTVRAELRALGFADGRLIQASGVHCAVAVQDDLVVLAFRGSTTFDDWVTDVKFAQVKGRKTGLTGRVHRGFWAAIDTAWDEILLELGPEVANGRRLWITGHSLGGALAQLAALRATRDGLPVAGVYVYGAPRVGDERVAEELDAAVPGTLFRIVIADDPVPHMAPSDRAEKPFVQLVAGSSQRSVRWSLRGLMKLTSYRHAGQRIELRTHGSGQLSPVDDDHDVRFWSEMEQTFGSGGWLRMFADGGTAARSHVLSSYVERHGSPDTRP